MSYHEKNVVPSILGIGGRKRGRLRVFQSLMLLILLLAVFTIGVSTMAGGGTTATTTVYYFDLYGKVGNVLDHWRLFSVRSDGTGQTSLADYPTSGNPPLIFCDPVPSYQTHGAK